MNCDPVTSALLNHQYDTFINNITPPDTNILAVIEIPPELMHKHFPATHVV